MSLHVFLRDGMGAHDHGQSVDCFDKRLEVADIRTRRITDYQAGSQMNDLGAVFIHLLWDILDVSAGAAAAIRITDDFHRFCDRVTGKSANAFPQRAETLPPPAILVACADDDTDLGHIKLFSYYVIGGKRVFNLFKLISAVIPLEC